MKNRLTTLDIVSLIKELQQSLIGLRVDQIYDVDKKTYLIRLVKTDVKKILVLESGVRFHTTTFEWPKNPAPSGFSMKLRKHVNNKRLESITQLGADRIVDFQFGTESFTHHILLELYDKGNIVLTDCNYNILSLLRPRIAGEERLAAHERYAWEKAKQDFSLQEDVVKSLVDVNGGKSIREIFLSKVEFGPTLLSYVLASQNLTPATKIPSIPSESSETADKTVINDFSDKLFKALEHGRSILEDFKPAGGFVTLTSGETQKTGKKKNQKQGAGESEEVVEEPPKKENTPLFYDQFHPTVLLPHFENIETIKFDSFDTTVDDFFSKIESQKLDMKQLNQEKDALKKLERFKLTHLQRLEQLKVGQEVDKRKAELISMNQNLVDAAISAIRKLVANQIPWNEIWEQIQLAKSNGDPLASTIEKINLIRNQFTISLRDPYETPDGDDENETTKTLVDIDLDLSAYANATKYYDLKRQSAKKEERTLESQDKAFKSTERKTLASLKEVATIQLIKKARKVYWFEKFRWCISSENYLILAGRDAQQNELLVKKYLKPRDVYLHTDAHGAPTVIIKNDTPELPVLPKTLNEAGTYAVCCSGSWDSKILSTCYWVWGDQVSKSAPSGEYLPTGSFMIRGKKNYLPPTQLVLGFGFFFRLTDESMENHKNERPRRPHLSSTSSSVSDNYNSNSSMATQQGEKTKVGMSTNTKGEDEKQNSKDVKEDAVEDNKRTEGEENKEEDEPSDSEFPDTQVKLKVVDAGLSKHRVRSQTLSSVMSSSDGIFPDDASSVSNFANIDDDESQNTVIINSGAGQTAVLSAQKMKRDKKRTDKKIAAGIIPPPEKKGQGTKNEVTETSDAGGKEEQQQQQQQKPKRGQHGRNKKLKEKYRFQDEEDRELRMRLIRGMDGGTNKKGNKGKNQSKNPILQQQSNPPPKSMPVAKNPPPQRQQQSNKSFPAQEKLAKDTVADDNSTVNEGTVEIQPTKEIPEDQNDKTVENGSGENSAQPTNSAPAKENTADKEEVKQKLESDLPEEHGEEVEEEEEEGTQEAEKNVLNSLIGSPQDDDELLFAVPVVAPYSTLQNYKFRIKMVPGSTKRGKAARSALESFLRDKSATQREKDLLKAVKDPDLARNFPGKVKLSSGHDKR